MNKYLIPISTSRKTWIEPIMANSLAECQDKLIAKLTDLYDLDDTLDYKDFIKQSKYLRVGEITDYEDYEFKNWS